MHKRGYHRLRMPDGRVVEGPLIVETDEKGNMLSYHLFLHEEANTEWIGGEYRVIET